MAPRTTKVEWSPKTVGMIEMLLTDVITSIAGVSDAVSGTSYYDGITVSFRFGPTVPATLKDDYCHISFLPDGDKEELKTTAPCLRVWAHSHSGCFPSRVREVLMTLFPGAHHRVSVHGEPYHYWEGVSKKRLSEVARRLR